MESKYWSETEKSDKNEKWYDGYNNIQLVWGVLLNMCLYTYRKFVFYSIQYTLLCKYEWKIQKQIEFNIRSNVSHMNVAEWDENDVKNATKQNRSHKERERERPFVNGTNHKISQQNWCREHKPNQLNWDGHGQRPNEMKWTTNNNSNNSNRKKRLM